MGEKCSPFQQGFYIFVVEKPKFHNRRKKNFNKPGKTQ
jgi:hypothetical protein